VTGYRTLGFRAQNAVGTDPFDAPGLIDGVSPYWRAAIEPQWGPHSLMVGTFGMYSAINPWIDPTFATGTMGTFAQSDKYTDVGFDTQYQYQGSIMVPTAHNLTQSQIAAVAAYVSHLK
jgi:hypothetical protein